MANLPGFVTYGRVVGQFIQAVADTGDPGQEPDQLPMSGSVTFTPDVSPVKLPTVPATMFQKSISATLDSEGFLLGPDGVTRGVTLISSDSPSSAGDFTYSVTISLEGAAAISFSFFLAAGAVVDLTNVISTVPSNPSDLQIALAEIGAVAATLQTQANATQIILNTALTPATSETASGTRTFSQAEVQNTYKRISLSGNLTIAALPTPAGDYALRAVATELELVQNNTTPYTVTHPTNVKWPDDVVPLMPTGLSRVQTVVYEWNGQGGSGQWRGYLGGEFSA